MNLKNNTKVSKFLDTRNEIKKKKRKVESHAAIFLCCYFVRSCTYVFYRSLISDLSNRNLSANYKNK